eukprot:a685309_24.p2 GENE.a685309_24~~a685309_24.p2  ORF type:complete len:160 (-),score=26.68 a685309_24:43-498(-)
MAAGRVKKEKAKLEGNPSEKWTVRFDDELEWTVTVLGARDTAFENGRFVFSVHFGPEFPFKPPTMRLRTRIWHPSFTFDNSSFDLLILMHDRWSPAHSMSLVFDALFEKIAIPDVDAPLNAEAAVEFRDDRRAFEARARALVLEHARPAAE